MTSITRTKNKPTRAPHRAPNLGLSGINVIRQDNDINSGTNLISSLT